MSDRPLLTRTVYVARPIDLGALGDEKEGRIAEVHQDLVTAGAVTYDPAGAFRVPAGCAPRDEVQRINKAAIDLADAVVGCFPENSIGVPMEMQYAHLIGKPVAVCSEVTGRSWALAEFSDIDCTWVDWTDQLRGEIEGAEARGAIGDLLKYTGDQRWAPSRSHGDDAGFDLFVSEDTFIPRGQVADVPCGVRLELPEGLWGLVIGRSSTIRKHHLTVNAAVIDGGYRGPMFAAVHNTGTADFQATAGMRLAQFIPLPNYAMDLTAMAVPELSAGSRGEAGFGSTGT